jgi:tetratricopeptide (TPR) repeat protein
MARLRQGKADEAADPLEEVVRRAPGQLDAWRHLARIRMRQGQPAVAARCFRKALELQPDSAGDVCGLGEALWLGGERDEAIRTFQTALRINPADAVAWHELGAAHLSLGNLEAAIEEFRRALRLQPQLLQSRSSLGLALGRYGQWPEAVAEHRRAVQGQEQADQFWEKQGRPPAPGSMAQVVVFRCRLAYALEHAGARAEAAEVYRAALQRDPEWPGKFAAEARALAADQDVNRRDPRLAFEMINQVIQAVGEPSASQLDVLAAAQAALGQYPDAVRTEQQAVEKAAAAGETALLEALREHLRHYEKGELVTGGNP